MPAPYPPVPSQLEAALLVVLRDSVTWESALAPMDSSGTYSGTLTEPGSTGPFNALEYQRRDRELAWLDTRNAAAVVEVSLEVADVWNASALRPIMQGPQIGHITYNEQASAQGLLSKVVHVTNASVPRDALSTDKDLVGRDLLVYETLYNACANLFVPPPITSSGSEIPGVTAWATGYGSAQRKDISTALPLGRGLFEDPDKNLTDRDNQLAGYVAQLCVLLRDPFAYANRVYMAVYGADSREVETYSLVEPVFVAGYSYREGDEIYYEGTIYRVKAGVGSTTDVPWTSPWAWETVSEPNQRIWIAPPYLAGRNRLVYDVAERTLQWIPEGGTAVHVPQLVALSIPGVFSGQTLATLAQVPERKDGQYWRQKAGRIIPSGGTLTDSLSIENTASFQVQGFTIQNTGASMTVPGQGTVNFFDDSNAQANVGYASVKVAAMVQPNSTVEMPGGQNVEGVYGTLGGVTFGAPSKVSYDIGLPATQWTVEFDYTNLSGSTSGFKIKADLDGALVFDDTTPFYFNDQDGFPLTNGELVTSRPFVIQPTGGKQSFGVEWTGGGGDLHIRNIRFRSDATTEGRYRMLGTMAGSVSVCDVHGVDGVYDVVSWDFQVIETTPATMLLNYEKDPELPIRFLRFDVATFGTASPTPNVAGFERYRNDCLTRAMTSAQQSFNENMALAVESGTIPAFMSTGSVWDTAASERWMAFMESAEPRLRELEPVTEIVENRQYVVSTGSVVYQGQSYGVGETFYGAGTSWFYFASQGTLTQVGAWRRPRSTSIGRPAIVPAGVYWDSNGGTVAVANGPEMTYPQLASLQPWMIWAGFYVSQFEFYLPLPSYRQPPKIYPPPGPPGGYIEGFAGFSDTFEGNDTGAETLIGGSGWDGNWAAIENIYQSHVIATDDMAYAHGTPLGSMSSAEGLSSSGPTAYP